MSQIVFAAGMTDDPEILERSILVHRYRYYVMADPLIIDQTYDQLERQAREICPETSPVHGIGSDRQSSYPLHIAKLAAKQEAP